MKKLVLLVGESHNCSLCGKEELELLYNLKEIRKVIWEPLNKDIRSIKEVGLHPSFYFSHKEFLEEALRMFGKIYCVKNQWIRGFKHYQMIFEKSKKLYEKISKGVILTIVGILDVPVVEMLYATYNINYTSVFFHTITQGHNYSTNCYESYKRIVLPRLVKEIGKENAKKVEKLL